MLKNQDLQCKKQGQKCDQRKTQKLHTLAKKEIIP